ncbi:Protein of unknown function [Pyronema omphalodes CBS 100304]|uniref:Uncharacterized protein n=1 Tax=Pyronema omphalodes (strain CBS 100304) TaxID=1076935 RepID=U4L5N3_PYROM|nr:Protein of unknown function [Pyronema omphalodes CBS 100304]
MKPRRDSWRFDHISGR